MRLELPTLRVCLKWSPPSGCRPSKGHHAQVGTTRPTARDPRPASLSLFCFLGSRSTYSLLGPRPENHLHLLTFSIRKRYCEGHRFYSKLRHARHTRTQPGPHTRTRYLLSLSKCLRICLSNSDAAQWWPGFCPCGQRFGHGLDRDWPGRRTNLLGRGAMGGFRRRRTCVWASQICFKIHGDP